MKLWTYMHEEHWVSLLESELNDIETIVYADLRKLEEEWRKYEKIMLDDYQVALSDWDEGVLWTTKKIKKLLDGGE